MLMPSALTCEGIMAQPRAQRPQRPALPSFDRYDPVQKSQLPVAGLIASCRVLHNILGERFTGSPSPSLEATVRARPFATLFNAPTAATTPTTVQRPNTTNNRPGPISVQGARKRSRDEIEDEMDIEDEIMTTSTTTSAPSWTGSNQSLDRSEDGYSTPKRQRRNIPLDLPAGLQTADFELLPMSTLGTSSEPPKLRQHNSVDADMDMDMEMEMDTDLSSHPQSLYTTMVPSHGEAGDIRPLLPLQPSNWGESDHHLFVETVLPRMDMTKRDWNDFVC